MQAIKRKPVEFVNSTRVLVQPAGWNAVNRVHLTALSALEWSGRPS